MTVAFSVAFSMTIKIVLTAVQFDDKSVPQANKVNDIFLARSPDAESDNLAYAMNEGVPTA